VNVLAWPRLLATADGRPVAVAEDAWGRLVAAVPAGAKKLAIRYRPDWQRGLTLALAPAVMGAIGLVFLTRRTSLTNAQRAEL
jgi:threonine/homoserine efflux transporter RhtA